MRPHPHQPEDEGSDDVYGISGALEMTLQVLDPDEAAGGLDDSMPFYAGAGRTLFHENPGAAKLGEEIVVD